MKMTKAEQGRIRAHKYNVVCPKCGHSEPLGGYGVAQLTMDNVLTGKCRGCGVEHRVSGDAASPDVEIVEEGETE